MLLTCAPSKCFNCCIISHIHQSKTSKRFTATYAKIKEDSSSFPKIKKVLAQSAIAVLGLGFVDAGYSGDWSRIGAISNETEDVLKVAAFVVVPLCLFLILSPSKTPDK